MFEISKDYTFSASHQLDHLPPDHKCARLHGHNYRVRITVAAAQVDQRGFVIDYAELDPVGDWIDAHLDHRHLNEVLPCLSTAELLAQHLASVTQAVLHLDGIGVHLAAVTGDWSARVAGNAARVRRERGGG